MDTNIEKIEMRIDLLKDSFIDRYSKSEDKETLLMRELEAHELLFNEKAFPVWTHSNNRPLEYLNLNNYTDGDIIGIRDAYIKYIVNGADINWSGKYFYVRKESINKDEDDWYVDSKGRFCKRMPPTSSVIQSYIEAKIRFSYLNWLRNYNIPKKVKENLTLELACKGSKEYESIKTWFIQNSFCDPVTFVWKDRKSGYKKTLSGYLRDLEIRNYTEKLNDNEIQHIALNSFGIKIGISTIQHIKADEKSKIPPFIKE